MKLLTDIFVVQVICALALCAGLPFGLLLVASRPDRLDRAADALERRRTAATLAGAGLALLLIAFGTGFSKQQQTLPLAFVVLAVLLTVFFHGFSAGALLQGRALCPRGSDAQALTIGWLARAGSLAVPIVGIAIGAYLAASSVGTPVVAWIRPPKPTTEPSAGSTPEN